MHIALKHKVEFIPSSQLDFNYWDNLVSKQGYGRSLLYSWFLNCLGPWGVIYSKEHRLYLPVLLRKFGIIKKVIPIPFHTCSIPVWENPFEKNYPQNITELFRPFYWVDVYIGGLNDELNQKCGRTRRCQIIDLKDFHYNNHLTRSLKKTTGLHFEKSTIPENFIQQFRSAFKNNAPFLSQWHQGKFQQLIQDAVFNSKAYSTLVRDEEQKLLSMAIWVDTGIDLVYLKGFSTPEGKARNAMALNIDKVIQENFSTRELLDFGGSNQEGIARFFEGFGAKNMHYVQITKSPLKI